MENQASPSRLQRLLKGTQLPGLEMIVGRDRYGAELVANSTLWILTVAGGGGLGLALAGEHLGLNRAALGSVVIGCLATTLVIHAVGPKGESAFFPLIALLAGPAGTSVVWLAGPQYAVASAVVPAYVAACCLFFSRRVTIAAGVMALTAYTAIVTLDTGYPRPWSRVVLMVSTTAATGLVINRFVNNLGHLARSERELHIEVAEARVQLEVKVNEQVDEIDRLGQLRRFLTPQIADALLSGNAESALATHRAQIAVVFTDLRGFTRFSATAEPEEVVEVLNGYFGCVGHAVQSLGATVGGFAGDGILVYFNDPIPVDDPPGHALTMAQALRDPMAALAERWAHRGYPVGYGIGIAWGYATMSTIGFESRSEYTAIGSVVNLAARLCDHAESGEALLDLRAYDALSDRITAQPVEVELKGFGTTTAYRLEL